MENNSGQDSNSKKNSNIIYFLIVVVIALLGTDVYLYYQKRGSDEKVVYQNDEKTKLQAELDSLEAQIQQVNSSKTKMSAEMIAKNDSLQSKINVLRVELKKGKLTAAELSKAQEDIKQLRYFVADYTAEIDKLKQQNASLTTERDTLKTNLATVNTKATNLEAENKDLSTKVAVGSALKTSSLVLVPYKVKDNGKESINDKAKNAKKFKINFTVVNNTIATVGMHDIYVRVIDPAGNLVATPDASTFSADGQDLQYTYKTSIDYKNDDTPYVVDWINPQPFVKGAYTVILYADGFTMGKTTFTLK